ncbi:hypothetical protein [Herbaspirillum sp. RV1423]|uniref:hypothetical protein n=1 Tax=Herbaspirillum sp. RV1423 TaxID=1443993 RepID=UPI0004B5AA08|nr:hypothetical protein [Herbaspirillum sp. RV1423]
MNAITTNNVGKFTANRKIITEYLMTVLLILAVSSLIVLAGIALVANPNATEASFSLGKNLQFGGFTGIGIGLLSLPLFVIGYIKKAK